MSFLLALETKIQDWRTNKAYPFLLIALGGVLVALGWYAPFTFLLFVGFVPFLELIEVSFQKKQTYRLLLYVWLYFIIWNAGVYWWLWNAIGLGFVGVVLLNAALQLLPIVFYMITRRASAGILNYLALVSWWLFFEYIHLNWLLSYPWMNIGNAFGEMPSWVQWYEYTGTLGGTLWVLLANIIAYHVFVSQEIKIGALLAFVLVPIGVSYGMSSFYEESDKKVEVVVVQPNLDCYAEKFSRNPKTGEPSTNYVPYAEQMKRYIQLAKEKITDSTQYIVFPETAFHQNSPEENYTSNSFLLPILQFIKENNLILISGADTYKFYDTEGEIPQTARRTQDGDFYNAFNAAVQILPNKEYEFYHKSKLVIGAETNPIKMMLPEDKTEWLLFVDMMGSLGVQDERSVFKNNQNDAQVAPVVCWEAVYGEYCGEYVQAGANVIFVPTNEGWWGDTSAPHQLWGLSALRAIELRRSVARAANTGVSGFINEKGETVSESKYGEQIALRESVSLNPKITFYAQHGDYLGRLAGFLAVLFFIQAIVRKIREK